MPIFLSPHLPTSGEKHKAGASGAQPAPLEAEFGLAGKPRVAS